MNVPVAYKVLAWIVGCSTIFVCVAAVMLRVTDELSWWNQNKDLILVIDQAHGFLFMGVLVLVFVLSRRYSWEPVFMLSTMLLATIPFVSFWAERRATHAIQRAESPAAGPR